MYAMVPIVVASLLIFVAYWMFRRYRLRKYLQQQTLTQLQHRQTGMDYQQLLQQQHLDIRLLEVNI